MVIVFDFDGTILDSSRRHLDLLKSCVCERKIDLPLDDYLTYKADGNSTRDYLFKQCRLEKDLCEEICKEWESKIENEDYLKSDVLYSDAFPVINVLKDIGHRLFICSVRKREDNLKQQIDRLGLSCYIEDFYCVNQGNPVNRKAEYLKYVGARIMTGDTETDYHAAVKCSITPFMLNRGFRSKKYWNDRNIQSWDNLYVLNDFIKIV